MSLSKMPFYALSLWQPWAWASASGSVLVVNRGDIAPQTMPDWIGRRVAIHASKTWDDRGRDEMRELGIRCPMQVELARGALIGTATIERAFASTEAQQTPALMPDGQAVWCRGPLCIVLAEPLLIPRPIPCLGALGFWWIRDEQREQLGQQVVEVAGV